ncbi:MAG: CRISPR-associated endonuclease Cas2 [Anaerolineae bacterium]|nr:CRISPR-associated endonuclease Cas2 [Anaerolineae bacterium]MDW7992457.1 CRISPR-associated endonuclease Cas2 [Anaerolineae bacterium]
MKRPGEPSRTLYVVAYDIPDDRRRTRVHRVLSGFGKWTQYSVFECFLSEKERVMLMEKLGRVLKADEDSVRFYPLCAACVAKVETIGSEKPKEERVFVV